MAAVVLVAGCGGSKTVLFNERGIEFRYPWHELIRRDVERARDITAPGTTA